MSLAETSGSSGGYHKRYRFPYGGWGLQARLAPDPPVSLHSLTAELSRGGGHSSPGALWGHLLMDAYGTRCQEGFGFLGVKCLAESKTTAVGAQAEKPARKPRGCPALLCLARQLSLRVSPSSASPWLPPRLSWSLQHSCRHITFEMYGRDCPLRNRIHAPPAPVLWTLKASAAGVESPAGGGARGGSLPRRGTPGWPTCCVTTGKTLPFFGLYFLICYPG